MVIRPAIGNAPCAGLERQSACGQRQAETDRHALVASEACGTLIPD
jgi:hypothetical protein